MAIIRNEIPILEYDGTSQEILKPDHGEPVSRLPEKLAYLFVSENEIEMYACSRKAELAAEFETVTKTYPVWIIREEDGEEYCLCEAPLGAPAAAQLLDFLIFWGCGKIIAAGSCGVLTKKEENEFLIPVRALRDEGTSYHYLPAARYAEMDPEAVRAIERELQKKSLPYETCTTWTTDGFFRETRDMVQYRREEGCSTVEMECAALIAVARKRGSKFGQFLYTADTLADAGAYDERNWGRDSVLTALQLCVDIVRNW